MTKLIPIILVVLLLVVVVRDPRGMGELANLIVTVMGKPINAITIILNDLHPPPLTNDRRRPPAADRRFKINLSRTSSGTSSRDRDSRFVVHA